MKKVPAGFEKWDAIYDVSSRVTELGEQVNAKIGKVIFGISVVGIVAILYYQHQRIKKLEQRLLNMPEQ